MGFDLLLIATSANGLRVPSGAKCCICSQLLDDGVGLSGCTHNACYKCMKKISDFHGKCPIDGKPYDCRRYLHISDEVEGWLSTIKLKCCWFDGENCMATAISLRNANHHKEVCPNNPMNKRTEEQLAVTAYVENWMKSRDFFKSQLNCSSNSYDSVRSGSPSKPTQKPKPNKTGRQSKSGYGFRPNKRVIGHKFFTKDTISESDPNWRK